MATFEIQMPDGGIYQVEAPEGTTDTQAYQYALSQAPPPKKEVGLGEAFGIGLERGVGRFGSTITDIIPALAGSAVGADEYAQRQLEEAAAKEAALPAAVFDSYKDVGGVGDAAKFVLETVGEQVPNLGLALGTALTGGAAAPALLGGRALATKAATEAAKKEALKLVAKQSAAGQFAGAAFGSYALNAPEVFQNIYQETGETAPGTALLFGAAAASLDSILPVAIARNISAPVKAELTKKLLLKSGMNPSVLRSGAVGLGKGFGLEGVTEGAQEAISIAAERLIDDNPDVFGSKEFDRIMESAVRGAVAGGAFGGTGGGIQGAREKSAKKREQEAFELAEKELAEEKVKAEAEAKLVANVEEAQAQPEQGDLFGAPIATTLVPPARREGEPEVTPSVARFMAGRPEPETLVADFTDAEVREEAKLRARTNRTEESQEFANVWKEKKEALAARKAAIGAQIETQAEMFTAKGNLTRPVASQNTEIDAIVKQETNKQKADLTKLRKAQAAAEKARVAAANKEANAIKTAKNKAVLKQDQTAFSFEPSPEETANLAAEREAAVISEAEAIVQTRYAGASNKAGDALNLPRPTADVIAAEVAAEADIIRSRAPAEEARQGDLLTGQLPGKQTRAPLVGKALNKFLNDQGLPANAATKKAFAGRDLAVPEQRAQVVTDLRAVAERISSVDNINAIASLIQKLEPTPAAPVAKTAAPVAKTAAPVAKTAAPVEDVVAPAGKAAVATELEEASALAARIDTETTDFIAREIYDAKLAAGRIVNGRALSGLSVREQQEAIAKNVFPEDIKAVKQADGASLGLSRLLSAYRGYVTGDNTQSANPEAAQLLVEPIEKIIGKEEADALLPNISSATVEAFANMLSTINSRARTSVETMIRNEILPKYGRQNAPVYKGAAFSPEVSQLATRGRLAPLLNKLIPSQPIEIQRILRKIGTQNLKTKIVVGVTPEGTSGFYDPATDVITLSATQGMNEHTALHETSHASLAQALNNPDLQITKDFFKFFSDIKSQMGDAYGGQDLQEFAAELVGNPEFQALLKQIKAPESKTLWQTIMDSIANFFGFRKGQSAYTKGLDFIDKVLDVSQGVEPTLANELFLGTPKMGTEAVNKILTGGPAFAGKKLDNVRNGISKLYNQKGGGTLVSKALSAFRLQDLIKMTADKFPALSKLISNLQTLIMQRQGALDARKEEIKKTFRKLEKTQKAYPEQMLTLNEVAQEAKRQGFDLINIDKGFDASKLTKQRKAEYAALSARLKNLPADVQDAYSVMRKSLKEEWEQYRALVLSRAETKAQADTLAALFEKSAPLIGYITSKRFGDYHLAYNEPNGERVYTAFESPRQREQYEEANKDVIASEVVREDKLESIKYNASEHPSDGMVRKMMEAVPPEYRDEIYQAHLSFFPKESILQSTLRYEGTKGESKSLIRGWVDTMTRTSAKINSITYSPQIELALGEISKSQPGGFGSAVSDAITARQDFIRNPTFPKLTGFFATGAYSLFLLGNASSALINTSAILLLTYPMLVARYGFNDANTVLLSAMQEALPSFLPKNKQQDGLIEYKWQANPKYKALLDALNERGQLQHTLSREILEGARKDTVDYNGALAKTMNLLSMPFSGAEKYSRATSALATFNLAKKKGKSDAEAAAEAVNLVIDVHTTGMAAEGPSLMQHPVGRVMFTFKSFIWNSASVTGMTFYDSVAKEDKATRTMARNQLLGIYATSAAMGGINGLPFFGAAATLANILEGMNPFDDDDEPFNAKEAVRTATNDLVYKGPLNYLTNIEFSNRLGLANGLLFREDPYSIEKNGYVLTAMLQATGPVGSYLLGVGNAADELSEGEYLRALEGASPSALRNIFKTARYYKEGVRTRSGAELDTDLAGWTLFMQVLGFSPADVSNLYENRALFLNFQAKQRKRLGAIKKQYHIGRENGDVELVREARERLSALRKEFPGIADSKTLDRSYKSKKAYEKDLVLGLRIDRGLRDVADEKFLDEFIT